MNQPREVSPAEPRAQTVWPFDIGIVGTGIVGSHQLTREAEEVVRRSNHTFVIASGYGLPAYLETICPKVTDLGYLYEPGMNRMQTYERMAAEVISAAVAEGPVCLAVYGHPWVYCQPTALISRAAPLVGLHVEVFAGVSAFDTLIVDLGIDIAEHGIQMYEATDVLVRRRPLQPDVAAILWQPTVVGDPTYPSGSYTREQFVSLQEYLLTFYPADHQVKLITSKTHPLARSLVNTFALGTLAEQLTGVPSVGTLYIPPVVDRPVENEALMEFMVTAGSVPPR